MTEAQKLWNFCISVSSGWTENVFSLGLEPRQYTYLHEYDVEHNGFVVALHQSEYDGWIAASAIYCVLCALPRGMLPTPDHVASESDESMALDCRHRQTNDGIFAAVVALAVVVVMVSRCMVVWYRCYSDWMRTCIKLSIFWIIIWILNILYTVGFIILSYDLLENYTWFEGRNGFLMHVMPSPATFSILSVCYSCAEKLYLSFALSITYMNEQETYTHNF